MRTWRFSSAIGGTCWGQVAVRTQSSSSNRSEAAAEPRGSAAKPVPAALRQFQQIGRVNPHMCSTPFATDPSLSQASRGSSSLFEEATDAAREHIFATGGMNDNDSPLSKFMKPQHDNKRQFQCTLQQLGISNSTATSGADHEATAGKLSSSIFDGNEDLAPVALLAGELAAIAFAYLRYTLRTREVQGAAGDVCGRHEETCAQLMERLEKRSVFRIWEYDAAAAATGQEGTSTSTITAAALGGVPPQYCSSSSSGCRAHYDPGLVTVLFQGSHRGLEVNEVDKLSCTGMDDDAGAATDEDATGAGSAGSVVLGNWNSQEATDKANDMHNWVPVEDLMMSSSSSGPRDAAEGEAAAPPRQLQRGGGRCEPCQLCRGAAALLTEEVVLNHVVGFCFTDRSLGQHCSNTITT